MAEAFRQTSETGKYEDDLRGSLELILVWNTEREGWQGEYRAYLGDGQTQPLPDYLVAHPELDYADVANRVRLATSAATGDLILAANGREGYYFGAPLTFAYPGGSSQEIAWLRETVAGVIADRCANEGGREPSVADVMPAALALLL